MVGDSFGGDVDRLGSHARGVKVAKFVIVRVGDGRYLELKQPQLDDRGDCTGALRESASGKA